MEKLHIYSAIESYSKGKPVRFHMPGHKADNSFNKLFSNAKFDVTELINLDSLETPSGCIMQAEIDIARIMGAFRSWILTDGSTSGIYAMLYSVRKLGDKIIINRNAHKSVFNACKLLKIEPVILSQNILNGIMKPPSAEEVDRALTENPTAIGVLLTYPDYYGINFDIKAVKEILKKHDKLLLIDGAHGAHYRFCESDYAGDYADIWVDGAHKTFPTLTQGALLSTSNSKICNDLDEAVRLFRTTSPSYPIMASVEYGVKYMAENGKEKLIQLAVDVTEFKSEIEKAGYNIISNDDFTKIAVDFASVGISPMIAEEYLNKHKIYFELNDGRYILFMLSALSKGRDLNKLRNALLKIVGDKKNKNTFIARQGFEIGKRAVPYLTAIESEFEYIELSEAANRIAAENIGEFPPCYPLITAGEIIEQSTVSSLLQRRSIFGGYNGKIKVVK